MWSTFKLGYPNHGLLCVPPRKPFEGVADVMVRGGRAQGSCTLTLHAMNWCLVWREFAFYGVVRGINLWFLIKWKKPIGQLIIKMLGRIQHKLGVEGIGYEGFKGRVWRDKTWKSFFGTLVLWCSRRFRMGNLIDCGMVWERGRWMEVGMGWVDIAHGWQISAYRLWGHWCCDVWEVSADLNW